MGFLKKPRFKKSIDFGFGFKVPINHRPLRKNGGTYNSVSLSGPCAACGNGHPTIDLDPTEPLWDQIDLYGHEIVHAAIDFHRHLMLKHALDVRAESAQTETELAHEKED